MIAVLLLPQLPTSNQLPWSSSDWTIITIHIQLCQSMLYSSTLGLLLDDLPLSAVATCVQNMSQLKTPIIVEVDPVPVFQAMTCRVSPLQSVDVRSTQLVYSVHLFILSHFLCDCMHVPNDCWHHMCV